MATFMVLDAYDNIYSFSFFYEYIYIYDNIKLVGPAHDGRGATSSG
jgi:hypothetical protein